MDSQGPCGPRDRRSSRPGSDGSTHDWILLNRVTEYEMILISIVHNRIDQLDLIP